MPHTVRVTFHGVGPTERPVPADEQAVWLDVPQFERALDELAQLERTLVTFDDGNLSDLEIAAPRLAERGLAGAFYVCGGRIGSVGFLSARDLRELRDQGFVVGSHGMDHVEWRGLPAKRLVAEVAGSKARIEDALGAAVDEAACPFGAYDRQVLRAARDAGYTRVFTSDGDGPPLHEWLYPRTTITTKVLDAGRIPALRSPSWLRHLDCRVRATL